MIYLIRTSIPMKSKIKIVKQGKSFHTQINLFSKTLKDMGIGHNQIGTVQS